MAFPPDPLARLQNRQKDSVTELLCGADALGTSGQMLSSSQTETPAPSLSPCLESPGMSHLEVAKCSRQIAQQGKSLWQEIKI